MGIALTILLAGIIVQVTDYLELFGHNSVIPVIIGLAIIVVGVLFFLVLRRGATPKK
jgi:multisubunit Na+/H+ antiporter MnhC subunit